ncbi:MAG: pilin [Patescibacteria group bacterium]|nr:pilin [Patescibacteria group bacterium]
MKIKKIKIILITFLLIGFVLQAGFVLGAETDKTKLEVEYPFVPGADKPTSFETFVKYAFNFVISISGLICLATAIYGGIMYLVSTGEAEAITNAKKILFKGFLGLIIILSAYFILLKISPDLTVFSIPIKEAPKEYKKTNFIKYNSINKQVVMKENNHLSLINNHLSVIINQLSLITNNSYLRRSFVQVGPAKNLFVEYLCRSDLPSLEGERVSPDLSIIINH